MNGCSSKFALSAVQVCPQSRAGLHAAFSKFAQRLVQACAATLPNLRSTDSKLALGVGHGVFEGQVFGGHPSGGVRRGGLVTVDPSVRRLKRPVARRLIAGCGARGLLRSG